jgi:hypothetical protein
MGIYYDGNVYGIGWELYNEDYTKLVIKYEKRYEEKMTTEQIQEVQSDYDKLSDQDKAQCTYYVLTSCTTTYEINTTAMHVPYAVSKERLELFFQDSNENQLFGQVVLNL